MPLTADERELLRLVAQSPAPVAMSDFFEVINPRPPGVDENHPRHAALIERQIGLFEASVHLYQQKLVRVVHPADGSRPDLVEVTESGLAVLSG